MKTPSLLLIPLFAAALACPVLPVQAEDVPSTTIDASTFGAKPDDGRDNFDAIRAALAACEGKPHPHLVLAPGVYHFATDLVSTHRVFEAKGIDDLTIDGQGATLVFRGHANPFYFEKCKRLALRNVKVDWDRVPFSQGKVVAATANSIDVQVDPDYPITGSERIQAFMDYDPETHLPLANLDVFEGGMESVKTLGPQLLRITLRHRSEREKEAHQGKYLQASVGKLVVLRHEVYGNYGIDLTQCEDVTLDNVSIYACPGMGIHASLTRNITCNHVEVRIKPGSGRLMSTTADCQYYTFCSGTITIRDGFYEGMGDDGFNATAKYRAVLKVAGPSTIQIAVPVLKGWQGPLPAPGEKLVFQDAVSMALKGTAVVRAAKWSDADKAFVVDLETPLSGIAPKDLVYNETYLPKVLITKSTFQGMRSRAVLLSTHDVKVEDCKFRGMGYPAILLKGGLRHGAEGPVPASVEIRNCLFEGCGGAAVYGYADSMKRLAGALNNIVIEGNTVRDIPSLSAQRFAKEHPAWVHWSSGICLISAKECRIANNVFENRGPAIYLRNGEDITIEGNKANPPATVIIDDPTCKNITVAASNEGIKREAAAADIKPDLEYINDMR